MTRFDEWCLTLWAAFAEWRSKRHLTLSKDWSARVKDARNRLLGRTA